MMAIAPSCCQGFPIDRAPLAAARQSLCSTTPPRPSVARVGQPALGVERGGAARSGRGDRLLVIVVGHVAGRKDALDASVGAERHGPLNIVFLGQFHLPAQEGGVGRMADRQEQAGRGQLFAPCLRCWPRRTPVTPACRRRALPRARGSRPFRSWGSRGPARP